MMRSNSQPVRLVRVDEAVLAELIRMAVADAEPDDVTPPLGDGWTPERVTWLRAYHRERRSGFRGGSDEETSAIRVDGRIVGASRLHRTNPADVSEVEWGIWLVKSARGHGISKAVLRLAAERAARAGATRLVAKTTAGNEAMLRLLRRANAAIQTKPDGTVFAALELTDVQGRSRRPSGWRRLVGALSLLSLLVAMGSWLAALALQPTEGYLTTPTATFHTASTALTTDEIDVTDTEARAGDPSPDLGEYATVRIRAASADPDQPLFIGVGPKAEVEAYLASSDHESFVRAELNPLRATFALHPGTSIPAPPGDQDFWVASSAGAGTQVIEWDKGPGAWTLVVMHPEGRRGVGATLDVGLRFGQVVPIAVAATVAATALGVVWTRWWRNSVIANRSVRRGYPPG